ncbi:MAG: MGMT family protein [Candidatus Caenarcaniphilales bacterium]|nr:MGMT family protein [Candidatus Caenarcaniphilales bacterium]
MKNSSEQLQNKDKLNKPSVLKVSIMKVVRQIPDQKVMFFGQIADMVDSHARLVGYVLTGMNEEEMKLVPWYRVVAKDGFISSLKLGMKGHIQKKLLLREGYKLNGDKVDMNEHLWLFAGINHLEDRVDDYEGFIEGLKR